jgi:hypothetical protein
MAADLSGSRLLEMGRRQLMMGSLRTISVVRDLGLLFMIKMRAIEIPKSYQ